MITELQRFDAMMEYCPSDRLPNWELGMWQQTRQRWIEEGAKPCEIDGDWFSGGFLGMDRKKFVWFNGWATPGFESRVIEEDETTEVLQDGDGRLRRALKAGTLHGQRMSMDTYLRFAVETPADWGQMKHRYQSGPQRIMEPNWQKMACDWRERTCPLIFAHNCALRGFYWIARDFMGTENLSYAWYDYPDMMHDMMRFWADFLIASIAPFLEYGTIDYVCLNEDLAMKNGPLLSPETYRQFIFPELQRFASFIKSHGVRYMCIDSDGNPEAVVGMMMDAGTDILWPLERAAEQDPSRLRRQFGKQLRLWGGVDKRELARGKEAIRSHLQSLRPLVDEGGFVPHVDHTVPPDVSWDSFRYYMECKSLLLEGRL